MLDAFIKQWSAVPYQYLQNPLIILAIIPIALFIFFLLRKEFVPLRREEFEIKAFRRRAFLRYLIFVLRTFIFLAVLIALASPFIEREVIIKGDAFMNLLADNSSSFALFDTSVISQVKSEIAKNIRVETTTVGTGERSAIGDGIMTYLQKDGSILLISDGNNNVGADLGDVALYAARLNATINAILMNPINHDMRVMVRGPSKILESVESVFTVEVSSSTKSAPEYHLVVEVDGKIIIDSSTSEKITTFREVFSSGYHTIKAKIDTVDFFPQNNVYYKNVRVVPKPDILFWSKDDSPALILFEQLYKVASTTELPSDLSSYHSVIINNLNVQEISEDAVDRLSEFVSDGNGLFVIGGDDSFDRGGYKESSFETLLPVFVGAPSKEEGDVNIVLVLDISGSTGAAMGDDKAVDVEKAQALSILSDLKPANKVGVVAFNAKAFVIEPLSYIYEKTGLAEKISKLKDGGGTLISAGLQEAVEMLKFSEGTKNIILISDGMTQLYSSSETVAELAQKMGIRIYTVGVGFRTNRQIMQKLAVITNGIYFEADQSKRLKLLFGEPDTSDRDAFGLALLNANHFITSGLDLKATVTGFNYIAPKSTADLLVTTDAADPILTSWRYGLGRIAVLSTDDGTKYAGSLLAKDNSVLLARAMNWVIGDPSRKEEYYIDVEDTRIEEPTRLVVKSPTPPKAGDLVFFKVGENLYRASIVPMETGFHTVADAVFGVNYKEEYEELGFSETMEDITKATGGRLYKLSELDKLINDIKAKTVRSVVKKINLRWPFIILAIALFLLEITIRKLSKKHKMHG